MKLAFKFPPPKPDEDAFTRDRTRAEWFFKFIGWLIVIGTLRYAGEVTGSGLFTAASIFLSLEIAWLAFSFMRHRVEIRLFEERTTGLDAKVVINIAVAAAIGGLIYFFAAKAVSYGIGEVVRFHQQSATGRRP